MRWSGVDVVFFLRKKNISLLSHGYFPLSTITAAFSRWCFDMTASRNENACEISLCPCPFDDEPRQIVTVKDSRDWTMVQNRKKTQKKSHPIIHFPQAREWAKWACERSERSERASEWVSAVEHTSEVSSAEQANVWAVQANEWLDERMA